jgi:beta-carotene 15,15'-dioxygenase
METALLISIVLLGVPHGAADLLLSKKIYPGRNSILFFALYVMVAGFILLSWVYLPALVFLIFLLVSAWHFAETDLSEDGNLLRIGYGVWLITLLLSTHAAELLNSHNYFPGLPDTSADWITLHAPGFSYMLFLIGSGFFLTKTSQPRRLFIPFALLISGMYLPFLVHFSLYFLVWHCPTAMNVMRRFSGLSWIDYILATTPLILLSWLLFGIIWWVSPADQIVFWFFGLLAALTLPHSFLFHRVKES